MKNTKSINILTDLKCPICGSSISYNSKFYGCDNYKNGCDYKVWRNFMGVPLQDEDIEDLIAYGHTNREISGFYSRKHQRHFSCHLVFSNENHRVEFEKLEEAK